MLTEFIHKNLIKAKYELLEDGTYYGEIPNLKGVWANAKKLEDCRKELQEVLEGWLILKLRDGDPVYMAKGALKVRIPNPHQKDISKPLVAKIIHQADITAEEWDNV
jgi:predicted RNase H-like HicB family nuclease